METELIPISLYHPWYPRGFKESKHKQTDNHSEDASNANDELLLLPPTFLPEPSPKPSYSYPSADREIKQLLRWAEALPKSPRYRPPKPKTYRQSCQVASAPTDSKATQKVQPVSPAVSARETRPVTPPGHPPLEVLRVPRHDQCPHELSKLSAPPAQHYLGDTPSRSWRPVSWLGQGMVRVQNEAGTEWCVEFFSVSVNQLKSLQPKIEKMMETEIPPRMGRIFGYEILPWFFLTSFLRQNLPAREIPPSKIVICVHTTFCPGTNISETGCLGETTTRRVIKQVVQILEPLHKQGYAHQRVFRRGVHVDGDSVSLREPGLSVAEDLRYWAPERLGNPAMLASIEEDVWHLGLLCVELLSGGQIQWRSGGGDRIALAMEISVSPSLPVIPLFSPEGDSFVRFCLCKSPKSRPTIPQLLIHPWLN